MTGRASTWALAAFVATCPLAARAELSCTAFQRALILNDNDTIQDAGAIILPLVKTGWPNFSQDTSPDPQATYKAAIFQLILECAELPNDTLDSIVATHMKTAPQKQEQAREEAQKQKGMEIEVLPAPEVPYTDVTLQLTGEQRGAIGDQVRECWSKDADALNLEKMSVVLIVTIDQSGIARDAQVAPESQAQMTNPRFAAFAYRALRAPLESRCADFSKMIPPGYVGRVERLKLAFSS